MKTCRRFHVSASGPAHAFLAGVVWTPEGNRLLDPQADGLLATELYRVGINSLDVRLTSVWGHAEGNSNELEVHLRQVLQDLKGCERVMLFGTDVTHVFLGQGIASLVGLRRPCAFLPGCIVMPIPSPSTAIVKPLGEFRLCLQKIVR